MENLSLSDTPSHSTMSSIITPQKMNDQGNDSEDEDHHILPLATTSYHPPSSEKLMNFNRPISFWEHSKTQGAEQAPIVCWGGFASYSRIRYHLKTIGASGLDNGGQYITAWRLLEWPDGPTAKPTVMQRMKAGGGQFSRRVYVSHIARQQKCASVIVSPSVNRCMIIVTSEEGRSFAHGNAGALAATGSVTYVESAVLLNPDWLLGNKKRRPSDTSGSTISGNDLTQVPFDERLIFEDPSCDAVLSRFQEYFKARRPSNDVLKCSAEVMEERIHEAVVNNYRLLPESERAFYEKQRDKLLSCFLGFPCGQTYFDLRRDGIANIYVEPAIHENGSKGMNSPGGRLKTSDARVWRILHSYTSSSSIVGPDLALCRWLAMLVAIFGTPENKQIAENAAWKAVLKCIGNCTTTLLHMVACDVMPNLMNANAMDSLGRRAPLKARCVRFAAKRIDLEAFHGKLDDSVHSTYSWSADDSKHNGAFNDSSSIVSADSGSNTDMRSRRVIRDLLTTDDKTAKLCGLDPKAGDIAILDLGADFERMPCSAIPGTSNFGALRSVVIRRNIPNEEIRYARLC